MADIGFGVNPAAPQVDVGLSKAGTEAIRRMHDRAAKSNIAQAQDELMQGLDQSQLQQGMLADQERQATALGGDTAALASALRNKAERRYAEDLNRLQRIAQYEAPVENLRKIQQGIGAQEAEAKSFVKELQAINQRDQLRKQRDEMERQNRARVIGSVLGGIGAIGGAALGGTAGANVGYQAGNTAGTLASE